MSKPSSAAVLPQQHPFVKAFPQLAAVVMFVAAVVKLIAGAWRLAWPWRRELTLAVLLVALWVGAGPGAAVRLGVCRQSRG